MWQYGGSAGSLHAHSGLTQRKLQGGTAWSAGVSQQVGQDLKATLLDAREGWQVGRGVGAAQVESASRWTLVVGDS